LAEAACEVTLLHAFRLSDCSLAQAHDKFRNFDVALSYIKVDRTFHLKD